MVSESVLMMMKWRIVKLVVVVDVVELAAAVADAAAVAAVVVVVVWAEPGDGYMVMLVGSVSLVW